MKYEALRTVVGAKYSLEILELLQAESPRNYSAIEDHIPASSATIADRLHMLTEYELIGRDEKSQKDVQYFLTPRGETFLRDLEDLESVLLESN